MALAGWVRFLAVLLGFFGCIWVSLFVFNSTELFLGLLVAGVVGGLFLLNKPKNQAIAGQTAPADTPAARSPIASALLFGVVVVVGLALLLLLAFMGVFGGTYI